MYQHIHHLSNRCLPDDKKGQAHGWMTLARAFPSSAPVSPLECDLEIDMKKSEKKSRLQPESQPFQLHLARYRRIMGGLHKALVPGYGLFQVLLLPPPDQGNSTSIIPQRETVPWGWQGESPSVLPSSMCGMRWEIRQTTYLYSGTIQ